ncbi:MULTISPECIES: NAD(P)H-dependent oxidoreductase [unclassified Facklamia]|uniref:NAD(P)H-dependent oxidoreductase n=1 Tax=Aerococcaceae TaxID=186827 RepID=UPI0013D52C3F|nr:MULTISPECIES: NAD(P)H-dependent oxidoreductase [unclassified Facklamia]QQD65334.1 NAD(P)H-dependent oxidoreductase [Aerococcaceae bacterium zg-252]
MTEIHTLCIVAHPAIEESGSQQFLIQTGKSITHTEYIDLAKLDSSKAKIDFSKYHQIIFQFPLYWYQAPAILKKWIDENWHLYSKAELAGKTMGVVVIVGQKAQRYQLGGTEGRSISELLVSFELIAKYSQMRFKPIFPIYQFHYLTEKQKVKLLWRYGYYLEHLDAGDFMSMQRYILNRAHQLTESELSFTSDAQKMQWEMFLQKLEHSAYAIEEIVDLKKEW